MLEMVSNDFKCTFTLLWNMGTFQLLLRKETILTETIDSKIFCIKNHIKFCIFILVVHSKEYIFFSFIEVGTIFTTFLCQPYLQNLKYWFFISHSLDLHMNVLKRYVNKKKSILWYSWKYYRFRKLHAHILYEKFKLRIYKCM